MKDARSIASRILKSYSFYIVLGLIVAFVLAPIAWNTSQSTVAVVPLSGGIDGNNVAATSSMLHEASNDADAIVILVNSGGGGAASSESLYLETSAIARKMPVVASVDSTAASGAYQAIVPSDYIYAKPSSIVGSVGVLSTQPMDLEPSDTYIASGPNKLSQNQRHYSYILESVRRAFVESVYQNRGDKIELSRSELSHGRIYSGPQAVQNGVVDGLGGVNQAIRKAADLAGLSTYNVEYKAPNRTAKFLSRSAFLSARGDNKKMVSSNYFVGKTKSTNLLKIAPHFIQKQKTNQNINQEVYNGTT